MQPAKRLANGKKLSEVDARIYQNTGELPAGYEEVAPHELFDTLDFGQFAHEIKTYSSLPKSLQFILETEMANQATSFDGWSKERREAYYAAFGESRPPKEEPDGPVMAIFTGDQITAAEAKEREEPQQQPDAELEVPAAPLEMPEKISWAGSSLDELCTHACDFFSSGTVFDQELRAALSKLRGKSRPGAWDNLLASRLSLHPYERYSCTGFEVVVYYRARPQAYVALLFQAEKLFKFFFLRSICRQ